VMGLIVDVFNLLTQPVCARLLTRFNPSWHLTRPSRSGCNPRLPRAGSLSLGR